MLLSDFSVLITILLLIAVSGFFSAAEISLLGLSRYRAEQWANSPTPLGRAVAWLIARPAAMLGTILITITACNYIAESIAATWVIQHLGAGRLWVAIVGMAGAVIVFAEIAPILYAAANIDRVARFVALPVRLASLILFVPRWAISAIGNLLGGKQWPPGSLITVGELRTIISLESEHAPLEEEEEEMLHAIFEFADMIAREVMTPRHNIAAVPSTATLEQVALTAIPRRVSRLPVYKGDLDHIVGVVFVKDILLPLKEGQKDRPATEVMRGYLTVPETKKVSELLEELRHRKQMLAIVVDEHRRTSGLITIEDLLEEIFGSIFDEYDLATPAVERVGDDIIVDGRMSLAEANELLDAELPEGRYATLAGLLLNRLGAVPREGERARVDDFILTVTRMDDQRIARVRITRAQDHPNDHSGGASENA